MSGGCIFILGWGYREEDHVLSARDFPTWAPYEHDHYNGSATRTSGPKSRGSPHIETWDVQAGNMARQFSAIYGTELREERLTAIDDLRNMHDGEPRKSPLTFARHARGTLNHRWGEEIRDIASISRLRAGEERPTFGQLKAVGTTIREGTGETVYQRPRTFDLGRKDGYCQKEVLRKLHEEKEVADWKQHHGHTDTRAPVDRTGADEQPRSMLPGPPLTPSERRIARTSAQPNAQGEKIFWNFNTHSGCPDLHCPRAREYYKTPDQLTPALWLVLTKKGVQKTTQGGTRSGG